MEYEAGTLILDVVDSRTNRVVWRGWAQDSFDGVIDNRDRLERVINRAVAQMLARFPPPSLVVAGLRAGCRNAPLRQGEQRCIPYYVPVQLTAVAMSALVLTACASMKVYSYTEPGVDLAQYVTYEWGPPDQRTTGDPRLDNNPFFQERIQSDVDRQLTRRGYVKATAAPPDLTVRYHARIGQEVDVDAVDQITGYCPGNDCEAVVYETGTLAFDLVDTRTGRVVWRAWAEGSLEGVVNNQDWMEHRIDEVVARVFDQSLRKR